MIIEPPQSAEMDLFEEAGAAAAVASVAMSTILLAEGALALEVPLARLGAMAYVRSEKGVLRGKENEHGKEREVWE